MNCLIYLALALRGAAGAGHGVAWRSVAWHGLGQNSELAGFKALGIWNLSLLVQENILDLFVVQRTDSAGRPSGLAGAGSSP